MLRCKMFFHNVFLNAAAWLIFAAAFIWALRVFEEVAHSLKHKYKEFTVFRPMRRRGEAMVKAAGMLGGPFWVTNKSSKGTNALCRFDLFQEAINRWMSATISVVDPTKYQDRRLERTLAIVDPTFTFAEHEGVAFLAHTGSKLEFQRLAEELVLRVTGYRKSQVEEKYFNKATSILIEHDRRLFVPFQFENENLISMDSQMRRFQKTFQDAEENLLPPRDSGFYFDKN